MSDDIEKQIELALSQHFNTGLHWNAEANATSIKNAMRDLLTGKFKEDPLPEIAKPNGLSGKPSTHTDGNGLIRIEWTEAHSHDWCIYGPKMESKRAAIEAWNSVFGK